MDVRYIRIKKMAYNLKILAVVIFVTGLCCSPAMADSTVTVPVPDTVTNESKNLVLTITVPTSLERTYQQEPNKQAEEKPKKSNYNKYFDMNPFPNMVNRDEVDVLKRFAKRNIVENVSAVSVKENFIINNYEMSRTLVSIVNTVLRMQPEEIAKSGITRTDILDLIKVFDNYTKEMKMFNVGAKQREKLNKLSNKLSFTDGEVKVIKVETNDIGGTVIHLTLNDQKGKYRPQYLSKLDPLPQQTAEVQVFSGSSPATNINPDSLQFSNSEPKPPVNNNPNDSGAGLPPETPPVNNTGNGGSSGGTNSGGESGGELPPPPPME